MYAHPVLDFRFSIDNAVVTFVLCELILFPELIHLLPC